MSRRPVASGLPERHLRRNSPQIHVYTGTRRRWPVRVMVLVVLAGGLIAAGRTGTLPRLSLPSFSSNALPPPDHLAAIGPQRRGVRIAGTAVTLSWAGVRGATRYGLEVTPLGGRDPFGHPGLRVLLQTTSYRWTALDPGTYVWRVRARTRQGWSAFSGEERLVVAPPTVSAPTLFRPADGARTGTDVRFCWSPVRGVSWYDLWIFGRKPVTVKGTCRTVNLPRGRYFWSAASVVRARHTYTSQFAPSRHLTVAARTRFVPRVHQTGSSLPHAAPAPILPPPTAQPRVSVPIPPKSVAPAVSTHPTAVRPVPRPTPAPTARPAPAPVPTKAPSGAAGCIPLYTC